MADQRQSVDPTWDGAVPAAGLAGYIRIPFPGPGNLVLSLRPPARFKKSTCSIFIMKDGSQFKGLRLDFSENIRTGRIEYHWNLQGNAALKNNFRPKIYDHMPAGTTGMVLFRGAQAFRYLGTTLVIVGFAADMFSIVESSNPLRRSTEVVSAWALAGAGARVGGAIGARVGAVGGSFVEPGLGTAVGGIVFGLAGAAIGGYEGYKHGEAAGGQVYDWAADTVFTPLHKVPVPPSVLK